MGRTMHKTSNISGRYASDKATALGRVMVARNKYAIRVCPNLNFDITMINGKLFFRFGKVVISELPQVQIT